MNGLRLKQSCFGFKARTPKSNLLRAEILRVCGFFFKGSCPHGRNSADRPGSTWSLMYPFPLLGTMCESLSNRAAF